MADTISVWNPLINVDFFMCMIYTIVVSIGGVCLERIRKRSAV